MANTSVSRTSHANGEITAVETLSKNYRTTGKYERSLSAHDQVKIYLFGRHTQTVTIIKWETFDSPSIIFCYLSNRFYALDVIRSSKYFGEQTVIKRLITAKSVFYQYAEQSAKELFRFVRAVHANWFFFSPKVHFCWVSSTSCEPSIFELAAPRAVSKDVGVPTYPTGFRVRDVSRNSRSFLFLKEMLFETPLPISHRLIWTDDLSVKRERTLVQLSAKGHEVSGFDSGPRLASYLVSSPRKSNDIAKLRLCFASVPKGKVGKATPRETSVKKKILVLDRILRMAGCVHRFLRRHTSTSALLTWAWAGLSFKWKRVSIRLPVSRKLTAKN